MKAYILLAIGVLSVGAAAILIREAAAPALVVAFWRLLIGGASLAIVVVARRAVWPKGEDLVRAVVAGVLLAVHFWSWIESLGRTSVAASVVLVCTQPIFVTLLAWLVLRERTPRLGVIAIAVAFGGAALIASDASSSASSTTAARNALSTGALIGDALALVGAVAIAVYVLVGRKSAARVDVMAYSATVSLVAAVTLAAPLAITAPTWAQALPPSATSWAWVVALALGPQLIGHTALNAALAKLPAPVVSGSILGEPVIATALAVAFLDERPGLRTLAGSVVVLGGVFVLLRATRPATVPA